jgi:serine/threonine protein kinase
MLLCFRSLGCTVVEMLCGYPPWYPLEVMAAMFKIATSDWPDYTLPDDATNAAHAFLVRCFQKDPDERASAEELLQHDFVKAI